MMPAQKPGRRCRVSTCSSLRPEVVAAALVRAHLPVFLAFLVALVVVVGVLNLCVLDVFAHGPSTEELGR